MLVKLKLTMPAPDPAQIVDDFKVALLEVQHLHGLGSQYQKREKDSRTDMQNLLRNISPRPCDDSQGVTYPSPRPPY